MSPLSRTAGVARADFRDRTRTRGPLLAVTASIAYLVYLITGGGVRFMFGWYGPEPRLYAGVHNAAWLAGTTALAGTVLLVLFGYFLTAGRLEVDRRRGIGPVLATTTVPDGCYVAGKWLSHFGVLALAVLALAAAAVAAFAVRGTGPLDPWGLLSPFLLTMLPSMALVAAVTVLLEVEDRLSGAGRGVIYFAAAAATLSPALPGGLPAVIDPYGIDLLRESMASALAAAEPRLAGDDPTFGFTNLAASVGTFRWGGVTWTAPRLAERLLVLTAAWGLVALAAVRFDRRSRGERRPSSSSRSTGARPRPVSKLPASGAVRETAAASLDGLSVPGRAGWWRLPLAEVRLALRGRSLWWYGLETLAVVAGSAAGAETAAEVVLPLAWVLGLPVWAELGVRERREGTSPLVLTSLRPVGQLACAWLAGVVVALLLGGGVAARMTLAGDTAGLVSLLAGALLAPSLAVGLGGTTGSPRPFEGVYLLLWYVGPVNGAAPLDFTAAARTGHLRLHLAAACTLVLLGLAARWRRARR